MDNTEKPDEAPIEIPINGTLDLHTFRPAEVKGLVADYLDECAARGILQVRIIHGKGQGTLRRTVHGALSRHPRVRSFRLADEGAGGWGRRWSSWRTRAGSRGGDAAEESQGGPPG